MYRHGRKYDHGLIEIQWRFRVRCGKKGEPKKDFTALKQEEGKKAFDIAVEEGLDAAGEV
eukprot:COSAG06_NODE_56000_length_287_cov_0.414894_1_plen_59_part_10